MTRFLKSIKQERLGAHVIQLRLKGGQQVKVLALLESETVITSLRLYERLGSMTIANEVQHFIEKLSGCMINRSDVRLVFNQDPKINRALDDTKELLKKKLGKLKTSTDQEYKFGEDFSISLDVSPDSLRAWLRQALLDYNIGAFRKRTAPYRVFRKLVKNRKLPTGEEVTAARLKEILKVM